MADFVLKYADARGQIHQQVATAGSEKELRDRYSQQGFLIYSIKPRALAAPLVSAASRLSKSKKINIEKFALRLVEALNVCSLGRAVRGRPGLECAGLYLR